MNKSAKASSHPRCGRLSATGEANICATKAHINNSERYLFTKSITARLILPFIQAAQRERISADGRRLAGPQAGDADSGAWEPVELDRSRATGDTQLPGLALEELFQLHRVFQVEC